MIATRRHERVRLLGPDGAPNHFRGFLGACLRTYVHDARRGERTRADYERRASAPPEPIEPPEVVWRQELATSAVAYALDLLERDDPEGYDVLRARVAGPAGLKGRELALLFGLSPSRAHDRLQGACERVQRLLVDYYVSSYVATGEQARTEYLALLPDLATAIQRRFHGVSESTGAPA